MYHAYNTAFVEKLGKPAVLVAKDSVVMSARRGASARICPAMRIVVAPESLPDMSFHPALDQELIDTVIHPNVVAIMDDIVDALLSPLTEEEKAIPHSVANPFAEEIVEGTAQEINDVFYERGYTQSLPVAIPTEEAVSEMPVSYTHLDVYKRQILQHLQRRLRLCIWWYRMGPVLAQVTLRRC